MAGPAGAARAADAVDVILRMMRHVEVEDVAHGRDVEAARGDVGGHEQGRLAAAEGVERGHAGALVHVAVQRRRREAVVHQGLLELGHLALAVAEDDAVLQLLGAADEPAQALALDMAFRAGGDEALDDGLGSGGGAGHLDALGVVQERVREALDLRRHRRREEQRLAREGHHLHDALDVGDEAHVEHAVGLVDDEELDAGQQQLAALEMVEQAPRRRDQHVGAAGQLGILVGEGDAADDQRDVELVVGAVALEILLDLGGELAGRLQDEGARHPRAGAAGLEQGQHRQREGRRLAGPGLGDAEHVAPRQDVGNGLGLDGRRLGVARGRDGLQDLVAQSEVGERHQLSGPLRAA
ncbi:hypothetical protein MET9862_05728 [Methylobacterium symbioticum]|uniref:Uncharacterized protein n=1 Tax=Methylobacterium symbioticum TaxID=2584084 RepID=A0A509ELQ3_9HYPH|nr:hypothetical protein MET9862_05728 [Methylobacterium symbioticum]